MSRSQNADFFFFAYLFCVLVNKIKLPKPTILFLFLMKKRQTEEEVGKTILKSEQEWTLPAQLGQLKTGQGGKGWLQIDLWCPNNLPRSWDRTE